MNAFKWGAKNRQSRESSGPDRLNWLRVVFVLAAIVLSLRLFSLQVLSYDTYRAAADGEHKFFQKLLPKRGEIFLRETGDSSELSSYITQLAGEKLFPAVTNRDYPLAYVVPTQITEPEKIADALVPILNPDLKDPKALQDAKDQLVVRLKKENDTYEVLGRKLSEDTVNKIKALNLTGVFFSSENKRFYPEPGLGGQVFGFVGYAGNTLRGLYGLEGYFENELKGKEGSLNLETDAVGAIIPIGERKVQEAVDGSSLVLTIDRVVQMVACDRLKAWVTQHGADGGSVIIMNPHNGAILAMCSAPDFDPSDYNKADPNSYANPAIFRPFEPGSILSPLLWRWVLSWARSHRLVPTQTLVVWSLAPTPLKTPTYLVTAYRL